MNVLYNFLIYMIICLVVFITICLIFFKWRFNFWKRKGVETLPTVIPFGHALTIVMQTQHFGELWKSIYLNFKNKGLKYGGAYFFSRPFFVPTDQELIKSIMLTDFQHFVNHGGFINEEVDPLSGHLFGLENEKWRVTRTKLSPAFTSSKMKMMFQTLLATTGGLIEIMDKSAERNVPIDIKDVLCCFTTDVIGSCAFGIECNSLKNPNCEFRQFGNKIFNLSNYDKLKMIMLPFFVPRKFLDVIKFRMTKPDIEDFFMNIVKYNVEFREKNNIYRKDFMHLLIQLRNLGKVTDEETLMDNQIREKGLTINEMAAQTFIFFAAGFETSSTLMTFALFELCNNKKIQKKLREEIKTVLKKYNNEITYDAIHEMTYMDKVCQETLRKYPPVPIHTRCCTKDYRVANSNVVIEEGTMVAISAMGVHYDPEYYPDPHVFDPERFNEANKKKRPGFTWLPFGEGPRICIGMRFGMMQSKVGLTTVLKNYEISLNSKTVFPLIFDKNSAIITSQSKIYINATRK